MTDRLPAGFIGHGNPMNVLDDGMSAPWTAWARSLPRPRAILAISAHWEDAPVSLGRTADHTELYYDFSGFPPEMYDVRYPAPGAPWLADRVHEVLSPHLDVARTDRPLDHGVWVPLARMYPSADVPVLELSMPRSMRERELYDLGAELSVLRDEGVFILGTGNLTHNLRRISWDPGPPAAWAAAFDGWVAKELRDRNDDALIAWDERAPEPFLNHPTADHYRPVLVVAGAARGDASRFPVEGFELRSVSRRAVQFDAA